MYFNSIVRKLILCCLLTVFISALLLLLKPPETVWAQSLFWGSKGSEVTVLQQKLKQWGYFYGFIDGKYGSQTYQAVRAFQRKNGLRADGVVGDQTRAALGMPSDKSKNTYPDKKTNNAGSTSISGQTSWETQLLAKVIEGEAAGESYTGKLAVGAVIMNRVKSSAFPNTLSGVVYQPNAFESVTNGQYNRSLSNESMQAAAQAMAGMDPTGGAVFFWNPGKAVSSWVWTRSIITRIGDHVFAR